MPSGVVKDHDTVALEPGELGALVIDGASGAARSSVNALTVDGPDVALRVGGADGQLVDAVRRRW